MRKISHKDINEIERRLAEKFQVQTEYFLGVKGRNIFQSRDAADAALYIIKGRMKVAPTGEMKDDGLKWCLSTFCCEPKGMEMGNPFRCPVCDTFLEEDKDAGLNLPPQCPI